MNNDIRTVIKDWKYTPDKVSVRKIKSADGQVRIQMRLDLGLLQMESTGRPDGKRPENCESLLDYYQKKLAQYKREHRTEIGFELTGSDCKKLRDEALMYYHRYLACFILEEYEQVLSDTQRNLEVFDLCAKYASRKGDRMIFDQHRPYLVMMNTRAKAKMAEKSGKYPIALKYIKTGLKEIKKLYDDAEQIEDFPYAPETEILKNLAKKIRTKLPANPIRILKKKLEIAITNEDFSEAARIRDQIKHFRQKKKKKKK